MPPFRLPRLPKREYILDTLERMQPQAGRIIGAISGMVLAGPAWFYGLCVGLLLGYMVDTVRAKATLGSTTTTKDSAGKQSDQKSLKDPMLEAEIDSYARLGLLPGASIAEVKKAWRLRSRLAHPDAPGGAAEEFIALKTAYERIIKQNNGNSIKP